MYIMPKTSFFRKLTARPSIFIVLAGLLVMAIAAPAASAHHKPDHAGGPQWQQELRDSLSIDLDDIDVTGGEYGAGTFDGSFDINSFDVDNGQLFAIGDLVGEFVPDEGEIVSFDESNVAVPVTTGNGNGFSIAQEDNGDTCPILFLEIDGVFLDLLGLVVDLEPVVLDIYAERGPGNLLGNLLCAIVGILDPVVDDPVGTPLDRLIDNVNRLLERILG
jgi:hypothetical protein